MPMKDFIRIQELLLTLMTSLQVEPHPRWNALLQWLSGHGMDISPDKAFVEARSSPGAGYGLFALQDLDPSTPLFRIPASALINSLTLAPHYPTAKPKLSCTQFISLHLLLHRPTASNTSKDPLFGPYISVLPEYFDSHPLTWLWRQRQNQIDLALESRLLKALPSRSLVKLSRMYDLFDKDWDRVQKYLRKHPVLLDNKARQLEGTIASRHSLEEDFLWAWLNVNTRCVYHRIAKSRSDPDNMTLCPILDFANHTANPPYTFPQPSPGEIWNSGPSIKKKLGDPFILLSPSTSSISIDQELFLRYGTHSNSTLFAEYGFVNMSPSDGTEGEVEMDALVEALFDQKGATGLWMKEVLVQEGYWGDWTMHSTPAQAFPSYRLITALRIFHLVANTDTVPEDSESLLEIWRDTTLGKRGIISEENERLWRATSMRLCGSLIEEAEKGITTIRDNDIYIGLEDTNAWLGSVRLFIEILHREGIEVAKAVEGSLREGLDF